jgi:flagellar protein FliJ
MGFRYSYQQIVDLKSSEKTQAEWILSQSIVQLREEEDVLDHLNAEKEDLSEQLIGETADSVPVSHIMLTQQYLQHLDRKIIRKHQDVQIAQVEVERSQDRLSDKMKDEKVWTKARERAFQQFSSTFQRKEQGVLDEIAAQRYIRHKK